MNLLLMSQAPPAAVGTGGAPDAASLNGTLTEHDTNTDDTLQFSAVVDAQVEAAKAPEGEIFALPEADLAMEKTAAATVDSPALPEGAEERDTVVSNRVTDEKLLTSDVAAVLPEASKAQVSDKIGSPQFSRASVSKLADTDPPEKVIPAQVQRMQTPAQTLVEGRFFIQQPASETAKILVAASVEKPAVDQKPLASLPIAAPAVASPLKTSLPQASLVAVAAANAAANGSQAASRGKVLLERVPPAASRSETAALPVTSTPHFAANSSGPIVPAQPAIPSLIQQFENLAQSVDQEITQVVSSSDRPAATTTVLAAAPTTGAETARQVAHQIAAAVTSGNAKTTEIALNPEELGRVRLSLSASDGAVTLVILADRPETQELMRRHIDVLAQEFRELGYESITFSFNADGQSDRAAKHEQTDQDPDIPIEQSHKEPMPAAVTTTVGLDLRL